MSSRTSSQPGEARFAVLIPCYRDAALLPLAIESVREDEPFELVVIDDASEHAPTDELLDRLESEGVTVVRMSCNGGTGPARNAGLRKTTAPFVFPLDSDDLAVPGVIGRMADKLEESPAAAVCFGDYLEFGDSELLRAVPEDLDPYRVAYTNEYPVSSLFRRTVLEDVGGWPTHGYEDWHLWMTLAERGMTGVHLGPGVPTYRRRLHGSRMLTAAKGSHSTLYSQLRREHPRLFEDLGEHRRRSRLSTLRKTLYPVVYGRRRRRVWEPYVKAALDRSGVWTLRR